MTDLKITAFPGITNAELDALDVVPIVDVSANVTKKIPISELDLRYAGGGGGTLVTTAGTQTLTNKTLTAPVINAPSGLVKSDVGLANVDNTSDATKNTAAATLTNKTMSATSNNFSNFRHGYEVDSPSSGVHGITGQFVGTTDTQTLTNKTLTAPAISGPTGIVKADVGLANVDNTSDASKNAATATLTNKTLTAPVINSPTGIVKGDVGLGNVDNTSDVNKPVSTAQTTAINNSTAYAIQRANHTGTQAAATITGLATVATSGLKADVGLGNVDNTSDATKNAASVNLTNKTLSSPTINTPSIQNASISGYETWDDYGGSVPTAPVAGKGLLYWRNGRFNYKSSVVPETGLGAGLIPVTKNASFTAAVGFKYLIDTSGGPVTATLQAGADPGQMAFSDSKATFNVNNLTIRPATGEAISTFGANNGLVLDVAGSAIGLTWDATNTIWVIDTPGYSALAGNSSSASGGSGKNYFALAPSSATGWAANGTATATTTNTAANLPELSVGSALVWTAGAIGDYIFRRWTVDPSDYNAPNVLLKAALKALSGYAGGNAKLELYSNTASNYAGTSTRIALNTDVSGVSGLSLAQNYLGYYSNPGSAAPYMELRVVTVVASGSLAMSSITTGPGQAVPANGGSTSPTAYTPLFTNFTATQSSFFWWRTNSNTMVIVGSVRFAGAASGTIKIGMPLGYTADVSKMPGYNGGGEVTDTLSHVGYASANVANTNQYLGRVLYASGGFTFGTESSGALDNWNATAPATWSSLSNIREFRVEIPIAEWAGSVTNIGQNAVEYAYNTNASTTAGDTTSFGYGAAGALIPAITTGYSNRVRFLTPYIDGDQITLQIDADGSGEYIDIGNSLNQLSTGRVIEAYKEMNSVGYGAGGIKRINATDVEMQFANYRSASGASTWGGAGSTWAGVAGARWRLKKTSGGIATGFGVVSSSAAGLMPVSNSSLDDATATRLGFKQYLHGTTYNGGNAPTVTCSQTGSSVNRGVFVPYQVQDGTWRLKFNITVSFTSASITALPAVNTAGVTFKNVANHYQSISASFGGSTIGSVTQARVDPNTGSAFVTQTTGSATNLVLLSGDVELESKPTWAY